VRRLCRLVSQLLAQVRRVRRVCRLTSSQLLVEVAHRRSVLSLHLRDHRRLPVHELLHVRRVRRDLGVLLEDGIGVHLELLIKLALELFDLLRALAVVLGDDCCNAVM